MNNLSYEQLCLLVEYDDFYKVVDTREKLEMYTNLLHKGYCKKNNIRANKIKFINGISDSTYGFYYDLEDKIYLNSKFLEVFDRCKENENRYYPYALLATIIHESRHKWQYHNIKKMFSKTASYREKLSLYSYDKKRYESTTISNLGIKDTTKYLTSRNLIKIVKVKFLEEEFKLEYNNYPHELDAEEEVINVLNQIYETALSENSLNILLNYVNDKRENNGLWFLSHEYYEDKDNPYDKKAFNVLKDVYMDYLRVVLDEHKKGNHFYHEEDYVFSLYPSISELIDKIKKSNIEIPSKSDDCKLIEKTFSNQVKTLVKRT